MGLGKNVATTMIRVENLELERKFYRDILGLKEVDHYPGGEVIFEAGGGTRIGLYPGAPSKADHTLACFLVDDIGAAIRELEGKGVKFEDYDTPALKTVNHVAIKDGMKSAWFRDPEGNCLGLGQLPRK